MADTTDLETQVAAALEALAPPPSRAPSDYLSDLTRIPPGSTRYQLQVAPAGQASLARSNAPRPVASVSVLFHHHLADALQERTYTAGDLQSYLRTLADVRWWRGHAAVHDVLNLPTVEIGRVGNVVSFSLELLVALVP